MRNKVKASNITHYWVSHLDKRMLCGVSNYSYGSVMGASNKDMVTCKKCLKKLAGGSIEP